MFLFDSRTLLVLSLAYCVATPVFAQPATEDAKALSISDIVERLAQPMIDSETCVGMSIGVLRGDERYVAGFGTLEKGADRVPDGNSVYEIGSITKVFTGLLLADAVTTGQLRLDERVHALLPKKAGVSAPADRSSITLLDLTTHTSGLPRLPANLDLSAKNANNPYVDYGTDKLYEFLKQQTLGRDKNPPYAYSNLGVGLLGTVLAKKTGGTYEEAVRSIICKPLKMADTSVSLSESQEKRFAIGYDTNLDPKHSWEFDALAGAGAIRSTVSDMLIFAQAQLNHKAFPALASAIELSQRPQQEILNGKRKIALGWHINGQTLWHNGQTGGYHSYLGINRPQHLAVVILCNTATGTIDQLGVKILDTLRGKEVSPTDAPRVAKLDEKTLAEYVGKYPLARNFVLDVTRDGAKLYVQATGQEKFRVFPSKKDEFFYKVVEAQISFKRNSDEEVTELVLHQNGQHMPAKRKIDDQPEKEKQK